MIFSLQLISLSLLFAKSVLFVLIYGKPLNRDRLIGDPKLFSLEERIFNTVCVIAFITMCFEIPFNLYVGLLVPALLCIFGFFFSLFVYYISRIRRKCSLGIQLFSFVCNVFFTINYFFNSGIFGPNLLLFSLGFLLIVAIIPKSQFKFWLSFNLLTVFTILLVEYFNPSFTKNAYDSEYTKVVDFGITYFVVITLTYFAINYIRKNYDLEKFAVEEKNKAIEEQKRELERLNSEKNKLISIVTHDIRTPLNSIQGYLELLADSGLGEMERLELKKQLLQITRDTSDMLTNVLSWSKTQMEGSHAEMVSIDVTEAFEKGLSIEKNIAARKGVSLTLNAPNQLTVLADKNMFQLVIRNLVNNAIKFTPAGGTVDINANREENFCYIVIKDNGLGIEESRRDSLFKLKASSTYGTNNERGIGLGLLLCKEFISIQRGEIWYAHNEGGGSIFTIRLGLG